MYLKKIGLFELTITPILFFVSLLMPGCKSEPTATMTINIDVNQCTTEYRASLWIGTPVTDLVTLDRVSNETDEVSDCGITELEYSFNKSPVVAKIEFQIDDEEVTAFIPMEKGVSVPKPFIDGDISLKSISVRVDFPNATPAPLVGFYQASVQN